MLYARINKEYINQDELAKKIVFERTISQVNKLYGEQKEVAMKPGKYNKHLMEEMKHLGCYHQTSKPRKLISKMLKKHGVVY